MEDYKRIYDIYIHKSDDELRKIINPKNGYSRTAIEVAWDILCYERRVEDLGYEDFEDLLKHHGMSLEENVGTLRESFSKESQTAEIVQKAGIVLLLVVLYPLGMFFLWKNKKFDKQFKIIESVCGFGLWILLSVFAAGKINNMTDAWKANSDDIKNVEDSRDVVAQQSEKKETEKPKEIKEPVKTEKPKATEMPKAKDEASQIEVETSTEEPDGVSDEEPQEENEVATATERQVSKLLFDGTNIIDETISFMKQYDYIADIAIEVDESSEDINIVVQVSSSIDIETAQMAGEDAARYLAFCASMANSYYSTPGSTDIGGIYKTYNLLLYVDDGLKTFDIYGAKVRTANSITWR